MFERKHLKISSVYCLDIIRILTPVCPHSTLANQSKIGQEHIRSKILYSVSDLKLVISRHF